MFTKNHLEILKNHQKIRGFLLVLTGPNLKLCVEIFTVPNGRIEIFTHSETIIYHNRSDTLKHKKEKYPKFKGRI